MSKEKSFVENIEDFLGIFSGALTNCLLYSHAHPQTKNLVRRAFQILDQLLNVKVKLTLAIIENKLIIEDILIPSQKIFTSNLIKKLLKNGIESVTFVRGLEYEELENLVKNLAYPIEEGEIKTIPSSLHIRLGKIDISPASDETGLQEERVKVYDKIYGFSIEIENYLNVLRDSFNEVKKKRKVKIGNLVEIINSFILIMKRELNPLLMLAPMRRHDQYTYTHALNVSLLTCYQASNLGFPPEDIKDIGLSAMLHDIGKLFIPLRILNKRDILTEKEWEIIENHPIEGAKLLFESEGITPLAIEVAYEHHIKYNLSGYPKPKYHKRINIISQMTSISDFYDALITKRPYRKPLSHEEAIQLIYWKSGTDFNPKLVSNFLTIISKK